MVRESLVNTLLLEDLALGVSTAPGRKRIEILGPFTEEVIGSVPEATPEDVVEAAVNARKAQVAWASRSLQERSEVLIRFHDLLIDNADLALDVVQAETGKSRVAAFEEVYDSAATARYYVNTAPGLLRRQRRTVSFPILTKAYEYRHPVGVVGSISPWNFPFNLSVADMIPALLAGNAVVAKPDEKTPFSLLYGKRLLEEAGLPEGLLQVVTGYGEDLGSTLIENVDFMMFTGSTQVGRVVAEQAASRLIGASMELGGKNAAVVMDDADLAKTVPGVARAVFANGGQLCIAMERIYVDEKIRAEFTSRFVEHTRNLSLSTDFDYTSDLSSMINRDHLDNVHGHVEDAVSNGATLLTGGKPRPDVGPLFYEPTVLTDVDESMELCRTETFGPVVSIYGYESLDDAIAMANDSEFGLNFSVWTRNVDKGVSTATQLQAGTVGVNDGFAATWSSYGAPMGGMKASGLGRRHGAVGILKYTESQTVAVQRIGPAFAPMGGMTYEQYQKMLGVVLKIMRRVPFYK